MCIRDSAYWDPAQKKYAARTVTLGADTLNLVLYGTGFDAITDVGAVAAGANFASNVTNHLIPLTPLAVGPVSGFPGIDQITFNLPASLAGAGTVTLNVTISGQSVNVVTFSVK